MGGRMRYFLFILVLLAFAAPAVADEPLIKVIREDGSVDVYNIPQRSPSPPPVETDSGPTLEDVMAATPVPPKEKPSSKPGMKLEPKPLKAAAANETPKKSEMKKEAKPSVHQASVAPAPKIIPPKPVAALSVPPGQEVTRELALAIALPHAPPARSVNVVQRTYEGKLVYLVQFKTDSGDRDVLVDARNGDVVLVK